MRTLPVLCCILACSAFLSAQPLFETQPVGGFPILPAVDIEGVGASPTGGFNGVPRVENAVQNCCGAPAAPGLQYAHLPANGASGGTLQIPNGGPMPLNLIPGFASEIQIPLPAAAGTISFSWEFFDAEQSTFYNDAAEVLIRDAAGNRIATLVYVDSSTLVTTASHGNCTDGIGFGLEAGAPTYISDRVQIFSGPLPVYTPGSYLSVICANDQDDVVASSFIIDDVLFNSTSTINCPQFTIDQPAGPGSLQIIINLPSAPNGTYLMPVTVFNAGAFPTGWCLGVDIGVVDLLTEISFGAPFFGVLNAAGNYTLVFGGVPPGLPIYAGCGIFNPGLVRQFSPISLTTL